MSDDEGGSKLGFDPWLGLLDLLGEAGVLMFGVQ